MCGIAGFWRRDGAPAAPATLRRMSDLLAHRGPDDAGHLLLASTSGAFRLDRFEPGEPPPGADLALAQRRLSILDLSPAGRQPMTNEDHTLWVVVNGEFYNYPELRRDLLARGHVLASHSDSETALHLYEEEGPDFVRRLQGMFALALFDLKHRRLVLARDRVGKKPLWYLANPGLCAFASEAKALWGAGLLERRLDPRALDQYLAYGYVPSPGSIFEGARKVEPGQVVIIEAAGEPVARRYWRLARTPKLALTPAEAAAEARRLIEAAVRRRLMSDVPLGAFLSGGLDSSLVVALMARHSSSRVRTFSVGFGEPGYDELAHARRVAAHLGTEHEDILVRPRLAETLPELVWYYGEPFADSSALPTYHLSRVTRRHVTVALNGDGGDEGFYGYRRYRGLALAARLAGLPRPLLAAGAAGFDFLSGLGRHERGRLEYGRRLFGGLARGQGLLGAYLAWHGLFAPEERRALYTPEFAARVGGLETGGYLGAALAQGGAEDPVEGFVAADFATYLPEDLLVKVDIASMAHALECRSPLLDHEVLEFAARLPAGLHLRGGRLKAVLKDAAAGLLPPAIIERPKMGFGLPVGRWFRGELGPWLAHRLLEGPLCREGWLARPALAGLLARHRAGREDATHRLWALAFLAQWCEGVLAGPAGPPARA